MIEIQATQRTKIGARCAKKMKNSEFLAAVLYGRNIENKNLQVTLKDVERVLDTKRGKNTLINLKVEGDKDYLALIKDFQGDIFTRRILHVDFWNVKENQTVEIEVETRLDGKPAGVEKGGVMEHVTRQVRLICEVGSIPDEIVIDVTPMEVGDTIHLADVKLPKGTRVQEKYNPTIVSVKEEKEEVVETVAAAPAEGEVAAAGAAPVAGAAPAAGAAAGAAPAAAAAAAAPAAAKGGDKKKK